MKIDDDTNKYKNGFDKKKKMKEDKIDWRKSDNNNWTFEKKMRKIANDTGEKMIN